MSKLQNDFRAEQFELNNTKTKQIGTLLFSFPWVKLVFAFVSRVNFNFSGYASCETFIIWLFDYLIIEKTLHIINCDFIGTGPDVSHVKYTLLIISH
jgi:hypothetical protein